MRLSIVGCPDKKRFRPFVKRAAEFYAKELMTEKMLENIFVRIKFNKKLTDLGYATINDYNDSGKPREFEIELHPGVGAVEILETLAHEFVHVKQYVYCETNENLTRWKGFKHEGDDYWNYPWEIEAHGMETGLLTKFVVQEQLWRFFKGIKDPTEPIKDVPLGWKEEILV